ncbi:hypothetical protein O7630_22075 [Micromonospora sp. WMMD718]|uniref:Uncharacterized protein n=1 Tax=Micromonospora aurantiaca (nom. illeg.) TaxID=47850 RepID=A0ABQ6UNB1_9ACTN|nr:MULTISPECIES: hypothetical protein [Micromonospora]KAB1118389.1 hypothetical protein F6X54_03615 [Micromonospora aurantiaca]MDG4753638.1 hypothetical protein [Micromonospora sp. WMMD718]RNI01906.1 hypothetical protein EEZ25_15090 [Micromonospora aurantiaca]UFN93358.1 hypothetical protein LF814_25775 [Micromonospora aurantiaca]
MPAKRSPKKSRKPSPSLLEVTPADLDALTVAPSTPVALPQGSDTPTPPRSGPPAGRDARTVGRGQRAGQTRFYAFRRS